MLGLRVDSWRGGSRLARDIPIAAWAWSEKWPAIPSGKLTLSAPPDWWPEHLTDPLRPAGQILRAEVHHAGRVIPLPPCRIVEAAESGGSVDVTADALDGAIAEDPWPHPSSPATGASVLREAARLARPLPVRSVMPDALLRTGIAWSGDRDEALLELAASRGARWQLDADGTLTLHPLGSISEPDRSYTGRHVIAAARKASRARISKASVVLQGGEGKAPVVTTRRLLDEAYQPEVYGVLGRVETVSGEVTEGQMIRQAEQMLAAGAGEREIAITLDPSLRAGMVARVHIERTSGREEIVGRVISYTIRHTGEQTITLREA